MASREEEVETASNGKRIRGTRKWRARTRVNEFEIERVLNDFDELGYDLYSMFQVGDRFVMIFTDPEAY